MWLKAEEILKAADEPVSLASLYEVWAAPPFGIRRGLLPILGMAFVLAHDSRWRSMPKRGSSPT